MAIMQREFKSGGYHVANDAPFLDDRLSWAAKGVLGYLFSKPEEWTPRMYDIVQNGPCKKYKIRSIFEELEKYGYLKREKVRTDDGTFDWEVTVCDHPRFDPGWEEPTPASGHSGQDRGYSKKDNQSERQSVNTEGESRAPAHAHEDTSNTPAPDDASPREDSSSSTDPTDCAAVDLYHEVMPRRANNVMQDYIRQTVEDLDRWETILKDWRAQGYNPHKVKDLLDVYTNGWRYDDERSAPGDPEGMTVNGTFKSHEEWRQQGDDYTVDADGIQRWRGLHRKEIPGVQNLNNDTDS